MRNYDEDIYNKDIHTDFISSIKCLYNVGAKRRNADYK